MSEAPTVSFVKGTCLLGTGATCCRYLTVDGQGFHCGKLDPAIAATIAKRITSGTFTAKGDNCPGKPADEVLG